MAVEQILKLIEAGYTKAEIDKMIIPADPPAADNILPNVPKGKAAETDPQPADPASEAKEETPAEAKEETPAEAKEDPLDGIKAQIAELTNTLGAISKAVINPTLDNVQPLGIDDIIVKFFKED